MSKKISRSELAAMLKLSAPRITQLEQDGVIPAPKDGLYDALACTLGYLAYVRRDDDGKASRAELRRMQAARIERRLRAELKRLISPKEVETILMDSWLLAREIHSRWLNQAYYILRGAIDDQKLMRLMGDMNAYGLGFQHSYERAVKELFAHLESGTCVETDRLNAMFASLMTEPAPAVQGEKLKADDPAAAETIDRHLRDIYAEGIAYRASISKGA